MGRETGPGPRGAAALGRFRLNDDGVEDPEGIVIAAAFTHADLAHMVGATRQWVTISLKRLQDKDIVTSRKSRIVVRRPDLLQEMKGQGD